MENLVKRSSSTSFRDIPQTPTNPDSLAPLIDSKDLVLQASDEPWLALQEKLLNKSEMGPQNIQNKIKSCQTHPCSQGEDSLSRNLPGTRERSIFVNFQKHLISTLKNHVRITSNPHNDPTVYLATKMWQIFEKSKHFSKKILFFLFGVSQDCKPLEPDDIYPQFRSLSTLYPAQEVAMAQEYLRQEVLRQSGKILNSNLLDFRRIKQKEQFRGYFQNFLEELEQGWVSRRLPKSSKKDMEEYQVYS